MWSTVQSKNTRFVTLPRQMRNLAGQTVTLAGKMSPSRPHCHPARHAMSPLRVPECHLPCTPPSLTRRRNVTHVHLGQRDTRQQGMHPPLAPARGGPPPLRLAHGDIPVMREIGRPGAQAIGGLAAHPHGQRAGCNLAAARKHLDEGGCLVPGPAAVVGADLPGLRGVGDRTVGRGAMRRRWGRCLCHPAG